MLIEHIPRLPGAYALELSLDQVTFLRVGHLGEALFPAGSYIYLGSARGPGGLQARLHRHIANRGHVAHWHIDHLRLSSQVLACAYFASATSQPVECLWAQALLTQPQASIVLAGFGASDCRCGCPAHLVHFSPAVSPAQPYLAQAGIQTRLCTAVGTSNITCLA